MHEPEIACSCGSCDPARLAKLGETTTEVLENYPHQAKVIRHMSGPDMPAAVPLLSGQKANRFNWLTSIASSDWAASGKSADRIDIFSNTVTEKTCSNV